MADESHPLPGKLAARFEVLGVLGRGSFGHVLAVRDRASGARAALKLVPGAAARPRDARELAIAARLSHPHLLATLGGGVEAGSLWLLMELAEGSLESVPPGPDRDGFVLARLREAVLGVAALHQAGIVHRDLKPANIMLAAGRAKVGDLGLAKATDLTTLTATGTILGSPLYMSPEAARGERATAASDTFALGVMLFEALEGKPPYPPLAGGELLLRVARAELDPFHSARGRHPASLLKAVQAALAPEPGARPGDLDAWHAELEAMGGPGPAPARATAALDSGPHSGTRTAARESTGARPLGRTAGARPLEVRPAPGPPRPARPVWLLVPALGLLVAVAARTPGVRPSHQDPPPEPAPVAPRPTPAPHRPEPDPATRDRLRLAVPAAWSEVVAALGRRGEPAPAREPLLAGADAWLAALGAWARAYDGTPDRPGREVGEDGRFLIDTLIQTTAHAKEQLKDRGPDGPRRKDELFQRVAAWLHATLAREAAVGWIRGAALLCMVPLDQRVAPSWPAWLLDRAEAAGTPYERLGLASHALLLVRKALVRRPDAADLCAWRTRAARLAGPATPELEAGTAADRGPVYPISLVGGWSEIFLAEAGPLGCPGQDRAAVLESAMGRLEAVDRLLAGRPVPHLSWDQVRKDLERELWAGTGLLPEATFTGLDRRIRDLGRTPPAKAGG